MNRAGLPAAALALLVLAAPAAFAEGGSQPLPQWGPHPRLLLDEATRAGLAAASKREGTAVAAAVERCADLEYRRDEADRDGYMGLDWAQNVQSCLVAWVATGREQYAREARRYFIALIDDLEHVGDGRGGNAAARRDSGYAIRGHGPYAALAYDWLYDRLDESVRARARERFVAWSDWHREHGYRARGPGTNYHAGYVLATTLAAVAAGGEGGEATDRLWVRTRDEIFGADLLPAARSGVLRGGDWGEGWQYAPLSVASYALAARAVRPYGIDVTPLDRWLDEVLLRHFHALDPPGLATFAAGDTQAETANIPVRSDTLAAVLLGGASAQSKRWAAAELQRLRTASAAGGFPLFAALAEAVQARPEPMPRLPGPQAYLSAGTSTLYARTRWGTEGSWFVAQCSRTIDVDHFQPNAGNFTLSRGADDLVVDPSPYGSLSTLTGNAPTVFSPQFPPNYHPSQSLWGEDTGWRSAGWAGDSVLVARCDYRSAYQFQHRPPDVDVATRDFVLWRPFDPDGMPDDVALIIIDRTRARAESQFFDARFRVAGKLTALPDGAQAVIGESRLSVASYLPANGQGSIASEPAGSCFDEARWTRGNCAAARFPVMQWQVRVPGPSATIVHLVSASSRGGTLGGARIAAPNLLGTLIVAGERTLALVTPEDSSREAAIAVPAGTLVVIVPAQDRETVLSSTPGEAGCLLRLVPGAASGSAPAGPRVQQLDGDCAASAPSPLEPPVGMDLPPATHRAQ